MQKNYPKEEISLGQEISVYKVVYPEVYYKLQPYIMLACDQVDIYGSQMPTQAIIDQITNGIYEDVCLMHPDLVEYDPGYTENQRKNQTVPVNYGSDNRRYDRRYRRRGFLRDLIDILFLQEFFSRRRRSY